MNSIPTLKGEVFKGINKKTWIIDTNLIAYWIINNKILNILISENILKKQFQEVYFNRYKESIKAIEKLIEKNQECFVFEFSINELVSTIRDEVSTIFMLNNGVPISRWIQERNNTKISENISLLIYEGILEEIDNLLKNNKSTFELLKTKELSDEENYLEVYSSLIFKGFKLKTQDSILLTSTIFNKANYFITEDKRLVEECKRIKIKENYGCEIIRAGTVQKILNSRKILA